MARKKQETMGQKLLNKKAVNSPSLFIQFVTLVALLFALISSIFVQEFNVVVKFLVSAVLIILGYNNHTIFKRKGFTFLYVLVGFAFLIMTVIGIYGS